VSARSASEEDEMVATSQPPYPTPEVPTEKGFDQTDVPSEKANEAPTAVPSVESVEQETGVGEEQQAE